MTVAIGTRARVVAVRTEVGDNIVDPSHEHRLFIIAGPSLKAWCRCEGVTPDNEFHSAGDIDIVPAGASGVWTDETSTVIHHVALCQTLLMDAAERVGRRPEAALIAPAFKRRDPRITHLAAALLPIPGEPPANDDLFTDSVALALATQLLNLTGERPVATGLAPLRLRRVKDYVEAHLEGPLRLEDLARTAGLSRAHFATAFKAATGLTPHQYVVRRRVDVARQRLLAGGVASAVALETGFAHQSHLAKAMRSVLGVTPRAIQMAAREASGGGRRSDKAG